MRRGVPVWITGVGAATPLGNTYHEIAERMLAGRSGVRPITNFDASQHPSRIGGQVEQVPCPPDWEPARFAQLPRQEQASLWCCNQALRDAGWWEQRGEVRIGLVIGTGAEWHVLWEADAVAGGKRVFQPEQDRHSLPELLCQHLQLSGPAVAVSAACASGNYTLALAKRWLEIGWVDVCLAGACDMALTPLSLAGFGNLRALSRRNEDPEGASRPFDRDRDGFVLGEGGALFLLEPATTARQRSAHVYAEVAGCGASSDAYHMVIPSPDPQHTITAMRRALHDARLDPAAVDYLNAHATSTPVGDVAEARALETVFGEAVRTVAVSSTKSMTGHLLAAAAAVEALACVLTLQQQTMPPTINLHNIDPECNLNHVANEARPGRVRIAMSNSFGFGGSNTSLVLRAA